LRVLEELPNALKNCSPANSLAHSAYHTWDTFQKEICRQGAVIEALPPTNEITNITVDIEITPLGLGRHLFFKNDSNLNHRSFIKII
jgi:hypothetical protein